MEDDRHILAVLSCQDKARRGRGSGGGEGEVVLNPNNLSGKRKTFLKLHFSALA